MKIKEILCELIACGRNRTQYISEYLASLGLAVDIQEYLPGHRNIEFATSNDKAKQDIIFFVHHDISLKTREGANDNTSSVAVLLALAKSIRGKAFPYNIRLVFTDNEELLGALSPSTTAEKLQQIMPHVGSFMYLSKFPDKKNIRHIIVMELSGIGDSIYVASQSGNVMTDVSLNKKLLDIAERNNFQSVQLKLPSTDMLSVKVFGVSGTVIGAIPYYQAQNYVMQGKMFPAVWQNIHSEKDNLFAIQEKALEMMKDFLLHILEEL